ncbi:MAG: D-hexose-6-phosphate mutarotase [Propioniciclava sp.]
MAFEISNTPMRGVLAKSDSAHYGILDHGAQVWSYRPAHQQPVLWLSSQSRFAADTAVRGGIPVVFPWFGTGPENTLTPAHGFARTATWHLSDTKDTMERDGRLLVEYELNEAMTSPQPFFPVPYTAYLRAKFTPEYLGVELEVANPGTEDLTFSNALHTYLAVGDVRQISIAGLAGADYVDTVTGEHQTQSGDIRITGETDRVYTSTGEVRVADPVGERTLTISKSGSATTVVWNPWIQRSAALPDMGDDEWSTMICIEAANTAGHEVTLQPGETHHLKQRIAVS